MPRCHHDSGRKHSLLFGPAVPVPPGHGDGEAYQRRRGEARPGLSSSNPFGVLFYTARTLNSTAQSRVTLSIAAVRALKSGLFTTTGGKESGLRSTRKRRHPRRPSLVAYACTSSCATSTTSWGALNPPAYDAWAERGSARFHPSDPLLPPPRPSPAAPSLVAHPRGAGSTQLLLSLLLCWLMITRGAECHACPQDTHE